MLFEVLGDMWVVNRNPRILLLWVTLSSAFLMRVLLFLNSRKQDLKSSS
jgi:hypothetical protein